MPLVANRKRSILTIAWVLAIFVVGLVLAACTGSPTQQLTGDPNPPGMLPGPIATTQGRAAAQLYDITLVIATIVFVLVEGLLIFITIRFRQRKTDTGLPPQTHGHNPLEILWTIVPAITVTALFVAALATLTNETEARSPNPAVTVDVTGFQWQWTFAYPEYPTTAGQPVSFTGAGHVGPEMVVPTQETVRIRLTAQDVIHSFYVPQFFYKRDVIPGVINEFEINITEAGTYGGQCAEFCGIGHAEMFFTVRAVPRAEFDTWIAEQQQAATPSQPPPPSGAPSITLAAVSTTAFDPSTLNAPADRPIVFNFSNTDPGGQPHNVAIQAANPDGTDWVGMPITNAGQTATYVSPPLPAKTYEFYCAVHPTTMRGTLVVGN